MLYFVCCLVCCCVLCWVLAIVRLLFAGMWWFVDWFGVAVCVVVFGGVLRLCWVLSVLVLRDCFHAL